MMSSDAQQLTAQDHAAVSQQDAAPAAEFSTPATDIIRAWGNALVDAGRVAAAVANTSVAPANYRGNVAELATVIMQAASVGLDPIQGLKNVYVVHGRAALNSNAMLGIAQKYGHVIEVETQTPEAVTVVARRAGSNREQRFTWTMDRAARAGYTRNPKYKSNPVEMLRAKAIAEAARVIAADALLGMPYAAEEIELETDTGARSISETPPHPLAAQDYAPAPISQPRAARGHAVSLDALLPAQQDGARNE